MGDVFRADSCVEDVAAFQPYVFTKNVKMILD